MANIDLNDINNARIHELRDFARKVGVISPTTMKKENIIASVMAIAEGKLEPFKNPPKHGRPARNHFSNNDAALAGSTMELSNEPYDDSIYDVFKHKYTLSVSDKPKEYGVEDIEFGVKEGLLDIKTQGYGCIRCDSFLPSAQDIFISIELIKSYGLRNGDKVKGYVKQIDTAKPFVMFEIISVNNGVAVKTNFDDMPYSEYVNTISVGNASIYMGSRNYATATFADTVKAISSIKDSSVKLLHLKATPEQNIASKDGFEYIPVYFNKTENDVISATTLLINNCKRLVEQGNNITLVIYNFSELLKTLNVAFTGKFDISYFNYQAIVKLKEMLFAAKYVDSNHSLTIIAVDKDIVNESILSVINSEFMDILNKVEL